ncbi:MAG: pantoate--beta-alanine ligase [Bacteroidales bacterium]|nr:pantoate--beta-alanine ligase [Bacteroidales bacterium]MCF8458162.1 pantoate--beta-alanine ligase [Bacteroidales bacterium]
MKIYTTIADLNAEISGLRKNGNTIGFVPTMGALHQGHISLLEESKKQTGCSVVSIFVNPTQFNNPEDFEKYPITIEADKEKLIAAGCDILFLPSVNEMYPKPDTREFDFDGIDRVMEGEFRPGHFNGVAQIVSKLFDAVRPDIAFFGQKDFQQLAIIKKMVEKLNYPVEIIGCTIVREEDGLAMSSRNVRLSTEERKKALLLSQCLFEVPNYSKSKTVQEVSDWVEGQFQNDAVYQFEYFRIVDDTSLQATLSWDEPGQKVACIAVHVGPVRLIDNIRIGD